MADGFGKDGESSLKMASKFGNKGGLFIPAGREVRNSARVSVPFRRYRGRPLWLTTASNSGEMSCPYPASRMLIAEASCDPAEA